jgi:hypothetical protein
VRYLRLILLILVSIIFFACKPKQPCVGCDGDGIPTQISIEGQRPLTFRITGSKTGWVSNISVLRISDREPAQGKQSEVLWSISPKSNAGDIRVADIQSITYGVVPSKFDQIVAAQTLERGVTYAIAVHNIDANGGWLTFKIDNETTKQ